MRMNREEGDQMNRRKKNDKEDDDNAPDIFEDDNDRYMKNRMVANKIAMNVFYGCQVRAFNPDWSLIGPPGYYDGEGIEVKDFLMGCIAIRLGYRWYWKMNETPMERVVKTVATLKQRINIMEVERSNIFKIKAKISDAEIKRAEQEMKKKKK
jgi:hypothetical protein